MANTSYEGDTFSEDKQAYADLADELNDFADDDPNRPSLSDFDEEIVAAAERYAKAKKLRFPPRIGDYDRFWEREQGTRKAGDL